jgi:tetratricopeptide (TPR) repeat protein
MKPTGRFVIAALAALALSAVVCAGEKPIATRTSLAAEVHRARALFDGDKIDEPFAILTDALNRTDIVRTPWAVAEAEWALGRIEERRGNSDLAQAHYVKGLAAAEANPDPVLEQRLGLRQNIVAMLVHQGKKALVLGRLRDIEGVLASEFGASWSTDETLARRFRPEDRYFAYTALSERASLLRDEGNLTGAAALFSDLVRKLESDLSPEERGGPKENPEVTGTTNVVRRLHWSYRELAGIRNLLGQADEAIDLQEKALALPHVHHEAYEQMIGEVELILDLAQRDGPTDELLPPA